MRTMAMVMTLALGAACAPSEEAEPRAVELTGPAAGQESAAASPGQTGRERVDPRQDGFEVGFGEFAVTLEAPAIRPGPVTFVVHNGGALVHGFEMEGETGDGDNSGPGGGDDDGFKVESETIEPGETIELDLTLAPGLYKVECFVGDHDDRGMEILLEVRPDAPTIEVETADGGDTVAITGFAFRPDALEVAAGTEVTWTNDDPAPHTVTADDGSFDSGTIDPGSSFSVRVDGPVTYVCAIHPTMKGSITVA